MLRLKRVLEAKGITMKGSAELLGISEKTLYNKIVGASKFTYGEVKNCGLCYQSIILTSCSRTSRTARERRKI